jgi:serine/threonine-protein kinase RsbT
MKPASPLYEKLSSTFKKYMSSGTAETILRRALQEAGVPLEQLSHQHIPALAPHLDRVIRLFVTSDRQERLRSELLVLGDVRAMALPPPQTILIRRENDISDARVAARELCAGVGASSLVVQKVATIVSELARNIVNYAGSGRIELGLPDAVSRRLQVRAVDSGPGINELDFVLSGQYRSKTGLGKGLLGVKRLADSFKVQTGTTGTRIEVEIAL